MHTVTAQENEVQVDKSTENRDGDGDGALGALDSKGTG